MIQIENEYYSTIRPKRICPSGERPINILNSEGIEYLELRCVDLDPFNPIGIDRNQIDFLDVFLLFCLSEESPPLETKEINSLKESHKRIINDGRNPNLKIFSEGAETGVSDLANDLLEKMNEIAEESKEFVFQDSDNLWKESLQKQKEKIDNLDLTPSAKVIERLINNKMSHEEFGLELAENNLSFFKDYNSSRKEEFSREASLSQERQNKIESQESLPFEEYLKEFLNKVS